MAVPSLTPLLLPLGAFIILVFGQEILVRPDFARSFTAHLSQYAFIQEGRNTWVPFWVSVSFLDYLTAQAGAFRARLEEIIKDPNAAKALHEELKKIVPDSGEQKSEKK